MFERSRKLYEEAKQYLPGGVNSPVRAFKAVGSDPVFIKRGQGSKVYDVDGNEYIDYVGSWGPLILGHAHPAVVEAVQETAAGGTSFGAPTEMETEMARLLIDAVPSLEMVRMVNSGTEAVISALRVARGFTGRNKIVKFAGCFHGHGDSLLIKAGSGVTTLGLPDSPGVTPGTAQDTLLAYFNNLDSVQELFEQNPGEIAAVILEPAAGNMGLVLPEPGFLEGLRDLTRQNGALLIFDEVMTGFRLAYGGGQERFGVTPDLTTLGKVIGGGLPVGAYGGRKDIMEHVAPVGPVYQAGTLSGNPLAMAAGITTLKELNQPGTYQHLEQMTSRLVQGIGEAAGKHGVPIYSRQAGSMFCAYFQAGPVYDFETAARSDLKQFGAYFRELLEHGVYIAASQFEAGFMSLVHTEEDLEKTVAAADKSFAALKNG